MKNFIWISALAVAGIVLTPCEAAAQSDSVKEAHLGEVVVKAVRASSKAPFAVTNVKKRELQSFAKTGRELPFLFANTPGVLAWSENGVGTGTVYMRLRGAAGSRVNVTLDGVALNSPEDQTVFWANMNSYGSLLGSAQIQRGVGTSTNGDGAFGGTISLATAAPSLFPSGEVNFSYGTYNTMNIGGSFSSGEILGHLVLQGGYHYTKTDGFLHGTDGHSGNYFGAASWLGDNFTLSYKNIGNFETTGQAWNGVTAGNDDATLMDQGIHTYKDMYKHGLGRFNSLYEGMVFDEDNWTFPQDAKGNFQTYRYKMNDGSLWKHTTDNFWQDHNILSFAWQPSERWSHHAALHYTYGHGYYREFRPNNKFKKFGIVATDAEGNGVKRADFIRHKGLTQHTYGAIYDVNYKDDYWDVVGGVNLQQFRGNHYGFLTYNSLADVAGMTFQKPYEGTRYYDSDAQKFDYSGFAKATRHITDFFDVFADLQYRHVAYRTSGINDKFVETASGYENQRLRIHEHYNFFNPKGGLNFHFAGGHRAYVSVAYAGREPERNNFTDNYNYPAPKEEHVVDYEAGYNYSGSNWHAGVNLYYMDYKDQFVQTGAKSEIGENLTTNIDKSYRMGAEISADWSPISWLTLAGNASFSQNKVKDFTEYAEDWGRDEGYRKIHYSKSTLAFSPSTILNGFLNFHYAGFEAVWHTNFVSRQYLDNTESRQRSLPCFSQSDLNLSYTLGLSKRMCGVREMVFGFNMSNLFDRHYANSGWVYSAYKDAQTPNDGQRYYQIGFVPMAGFTCMGNITLRF